MTHEKTNHSIFYDKLLNHIITKGLYQVKDVKELSDDVIKHKTRVIKTTQKGGFENAF